MNNVRFLVPNRVGRKTIKFWNVKIYVFMDFIFHANMHFQSFQDDSRWLTFVLRFYPQLSESILIFTEDWNVAAQNFGPIRWKIGVIHKKLNLKMLKRKQFSSTIFFPNYRIQFLFSQKLNSVQNKLWARLYEKKEGFPNT